MVTQEDRLRDAFWNLLTALTAAEARISVLEDEKTARDARDARDKVPYPRGV